MITIVDFGMGNLGSVQNMLTRIEAPSVISSDRNEIAAARKLILPGVGSYDSAMRRLNDLDLVPVLDQLALNDRIPILGICLGMQLLCKGSEEGERPGLGWIDATARRFPAQKGLKVPHMGWNVVRPTGPSALTDWMQNEEEPRFYFVHSYAVEVADPKHSLMKTHYGIDFDAGIHRDNIFGAQFHPEKSHRFGMSLFRAFVDL